MNDSQVTEIWEGLGNNPTPGRLGDTSEEETLGEETSDSAEASHRDMSTSPAVRASSGPQIKRPHGSPSRGKRFRDARQGNSQAGGAVTVRFDGPQEGYDWEIERIFLAGGAASTAEIFANGETAEYQVDSAASANKAVADQNHPIWIASRKPFIVVFAAVPAGTNPLVTIQGRNIPTEQE